MPARNPYSLLPARLPLVFRSSFVVFLSITIKIPQIDSRDCFNARILRRSRKLDTFLQCRLRDVLFLRHPPMHGVIFHRRRCHYVDTAERGLDLREMLLVLWQNKVLRLPERDQSKSRLPERVVD